LILAGAVSPVSFFAYPGRPSDLMPDGCSVTTLAGHRGAAAALTVLADDIAPGVAAPVAEAARPELPTGPLTALSAANVIGALLPDEAIIVDEANTAGLGLPALSAGNPGISCTATPAAGAGQSRGALGVGDEFALTVAAPAPVVERAGHLVALDGALG